MQFRIIFFTVGRLGVPIFLFLTGALTLKKQIDTDEDVLKFKEGLAIGEEKLTLPPELLILKSDAISEIKVTIVEGKFHQIKRMFEAVDKKVLFLKRLSMGSLILAEELALGEYRPLTEQEIRGLKGN